MNYRSFYECVNEQRKYLDKVEERLKVLESDIKDYNSDILICFHNSNKEHQTFSVYTKPGNQGEEFIVDNVLFRIDKDLYCDELLTLLEDFAKKVNEFDVEVII